jgi:hypothetical protein
MGPIRKDPELSSAVQKAGSAPELARNARRGSATPPLGRKGSYTDKPDFGDSGGEAAGRDGRHGTWRKRMAAAAAAVAILTMAGLFMAGPNVPNWLHHRTTVVEQAQAHTLIFTSQDQDHAATDKARAALQRGEVPPELADLPETARKEIVNGERALFTLRLVDEFNSLVYFHVDGAPALNWHVSDGRRLLTVALKKGEPALLRLTAARDNGNGVHLVAATSAGELRTRTMAVGETEDWTLLVK